MLLCLLPLYPFLGNKPMFLLSTKKMTNHVPTTTDQFPCYVVWKRYLSGWFSFLQENNVLTSFLSGFIPGDSSVNQLLYNVFCKALDDGLEVRSVFFHIRKAFDRVWHKGLLHKLKYTGVSGELLLWFKNYLSGCFTWCELPVEGLATRINLGTIAFPDLYQWHCLWHWV